MILRGLDFGNRRDIEGWEDDVCLGKVGFDLLRWRIRITVSGDDHQILCLLLGNVESCIVTENARFTDE